MATFAYGDVHGCFLTLMALRKKIGVTDEDTEIYCGDLVDRGPRIKETLDFVFKRRKQRENGTFIVIGNHDFCLYDYFTPLGPIKNSFMIHQGLSDSLRQLGDQAHDYANRLWKEGVPLVRDPSGKYIFCHADWNWDGQPFTDQNFWMRINASTHEKYDGPIIVHGHTPCDPEDMYEHKKDGTLFGINLDAGACNFEGNLVRVPSLRAMCVETGEIFEQPQIDFVPSSSRSL